MKKELAPTAVTTAPQSTTAPEVSEPTQLTSFEDAVRATVEAGSAQVTFSSSRDATDSCLISEQVMTRGIEFQQDGSQIYTEEDLDLAVDNGSLTLALGNEILTAGGSEIDPFGVRVVDGTTYFDMSGYIDRYEFEGPKTGGDFDPSVVGWVALDVSAMAEMGLSQWALDRLLLDALVTLLAADTVVHVGTEDVNGIPTTRYEALGIELGEMFEGGRLPIAVWLDEVGRVAKLEFDLFPEGHCDSGEVEEGRVVRWTHTVEFSDYGTPVSAEVPIDAMTYKDFQAITGLPF